jgi:hypothetical protein
MYLGFKRRKQIISFVVQREGVEERLGKARIHSRQAGSRAQSETSYPPSLICIGNQAQMSKRHFLFLTRAKKLKIIWLSGISEEA